MNKSKITITSMATHEDILYLSKQLRTFNLDVAPPHMAHPSEDIAFLLKNNDIILGGLSGKLYRNCLYIEILWLDQSIRGQYFGQLLMDKAEKFAREKACYFIHLDTFSFQAPDFYKKCGFEIFGVLDGYPEGIKRYYLKKNLSNSKE